MKPLKHASDPDICALCDKVATRKVYEEQAISIWAARSSYLCEEHNAKIFDLEQANDVSLQAE